MLAGGDRRHRTPVGSQENYRGNRDHEQRIHAWQLNTGLVLVRQRRGVPGAIVELDSRKHQNDPGGTWVHWVVYGISADDGRLPEGVPPSDTLDGGARQGKNDFGRTSYCGPCPPRKGPHRYFFKVYALDADLVLGSGATKAELVREMNGSILAQGELMGRYTRR